MEGEGAPLSHDPPKLLRTHPPLAPITRPVPVTRPVRMRKSPTTLSPLPSAHPGKMGLGLGADLGPGPAHPRPPAATRAANNNSM